MKEGLTDEVEKHMIKKQTVAFLSRRKLAGAFNHLTQDHGIVTTQFTFCVYEVNPFAV